jgi:hypothetical protein
MFLFICILALSYQNCSVYKSDGFEDFEKDLLSFNTRNDCLPFMDVNIASTIMNAGGISVSISGGSPSSERALNCKFTSRVNASAPTANVSCLITTSNRETDVYPRAANIDLFYSLSGQEAINVALQNVPDTIAGTFGVFAEDIEDRLFYGFTYHNTSGKVIYSYISRSANSTDPNNVCAGNGCALCKVSLNSEPSSSENVKNVLRNFVLHISNQNR